MSNYSCSGLTLSYPDKFRIKRDFPDLIIVNPQMGTELKVSLLYEGGTYERSYFLYIDTSNERVYDGKENKVIRTGDYSVFPGSKELLVQHVGLQSCTFSYYVLVPVGNRLLTISVTGIFSDYNWDSFEMILQEIDDTWAPIIKSIQFDAEIINGLTDEDDEAVVERRDWTKPGKKPKRFKYNFSPMYSYVGLYDSKTTLFDADESGPDDDDFEDIVLDLVEEKIIKKPGKLFLYPVETNDDVEATFFLGAEMPDMNEAKWDHVVEGNLAVASGVLCAASDANGDAELKIKLANGVYSFRIYFSRLNRAKFDDKPEQWQVFLWPADSGKETEELKIMKKYKN